MSGLSLYIYRIMSWLCAGMAWANAAIVLLDGCTGELQFRYRVITVLAAVLFGLIGAFVLASERMLSRILRLNSTPPCTQPETVLANAWRSLHWLLSLGVAFVITAMGLGLLAIVSRLDQGYKLFS